MFYNILFTGNSNYWKKFELLTEQELIAFVEAYNTGAHDFFANGETQDIAETKKVIIYDTSQNQYESRSELVKRFNDIRSTISRVNHEFMYSNYGKEVTSKYIKGKWGHKNSTEQIAADIYRQPIIKKPILKSGVTNQTRPMIKKVSSQRIFISHSSIDKEVVNMFCNLVLGAGLGIKLHEEVFSTSLPGSMPKSGEDFRNAISDQIKNAKLVLQFISHNYKKSEVCLNEMGAAWVLSNRVVPVIIEEGEYDIGFINAHVQQVQLHDERRIIAFVEDHKDVLSPDSRHNMAAVVDKVQEFVAWLKTYRAKTEVVTTPTFEEKDEKSRSASPAGKFYRIDEHAGLYYYENNEMREIPDDPTLYFLGFKRQDGVAIIKSSDKLAERIGLPVTSILKCEIRVDPSAPYPRIYWLFHEGKRHGLENATLKRIKEIQGNKYSPPITILTDALLKIPQGNKVDLSELAPLRK